MANLRLQNGAAPATPPAGYVSLYSKVDKRLYFKDDTGTEYLFSSPADTDGLPEGVVNFYFTDERAQDAVGTILVDSSKVTLTYVDGTPSITANIVAGSLTNTDISASAAIALTKLAALPASRGVVTDGSGVLTTGTTTAAEIGYLTGLTGPLQTQVDGKQPLDTDLTALAGISSNGLLVRTGSGTATVRTLQGNTQIGVANGSGTAGDPSISINASSITDAQISTTAAIDTSKLANGSVSNTEFQYLDGVTSAIQTQLNGKQATGNYITALTGDVTATGPGSVAATLATTGITPGTYISPSSVTVDSKGRLTAITAGQTWPFDPSLHSFLFSDFISDSAAGEIGWNTTNSGAGSVPTVGGYADVFNRAYGAATLPTGTTVTGRSCLSSGVAALGTAYGSLTQEWRFLIPTLSTGVEEYAAVVGFGDTVGAGHQQTNGIYFRYDRTVSTNWIAETAAGAVRTSTATSTAVVAATWMYLRIQVNAAGTSVTYYINNVLVATVTTNIPGFIQQFGPLFKIVKSVGTTSRTIVTDYMMLKIDLTSTR